MSDSFRLFPRLETPGLPACYSFIPLFSFRRIMLPHFISFSFLIATARTSKTMLNNTLLLVYAMFGLPVLWSMDTRVALMI